MIKQYLPDISHNAPDGIHGELTFATCSIVTFFVIPASCPTHFLMVVLRFMMIEKWEVVMAYRMLTHTFPGKVKMEMP
jgi:hypothetical protein